MKWNSVRNTSLTLMLYVLSVDLYATVCEFEAVRFTANFETAKLNSCAQLSENHYLLTTDAENRPINSSPWYAFKVEPKLEGKTTQIKISIQAEQAKPRYLPKMSRDSRIWHNLPFEIKDNQLTFEINLSQELYISAQEIINNDHYLNWMNDIVQTSSFTKINLGHSTLGRPIEALLSQKDNNTEWLLILGRQHPPEVTGALALLSFVEQLAQFSASQQAFLARFNVLIIPNMNPDGVALGNWRHNSKGLDLNRDWGKFTQIETSLVKAKLDSLLKGSQRLVFAVDFHSTQQDIFYTMPKDYDVAPPLFSSDWLRKIKSQSVASFVIRPKPGSSPGRGVFKQFIADTYKVHAVTFELGDNTQRELIDHVAKISSITLIEHMLDTPSQAFIFAPAAP
ncbi:M14 family metallopeptidase [uncultured Paraglaciecola sp.]|uniref:M14 family metallopeptidase n=1 Tax=uncultured Paraglaciecola sp. TaxID=1765024 RepID=UPI0030DC4A78|tara:strand:- start:478170 stop:479357 length:1188 start_codon:yes stop_codon:yes gene_type:complete